MVKINNDLMNWLRNTDIPLSVIARQTGISRKSLHNWKTGGNPSSTSMVKLNEFYSQMMNNRASVLTDKGAIDADYVISLQKNILDRVEADNKRLQEEIAMNKMNSDVWEKLEHHCYTEIELEVKKDGLYRRIVDTGDLKMMSLLLGYSVGELREDYFKEGKQYKMNDHPIDGIVDKNSLKVLRLYTKNYENTYNILKAMVGSHYLPLAITYKGKTGQRVHAQMYSKIGWKSFTVSTKVLYLV